MNPRTQDCLGQYLYGAGYFSRDENTLAMLGGGRGQQPHFCLSCPKLAECEDEHEKLVRDRLPEQAEQFDRLMLQARQRGLGPTMAAAYLAQRGLDPFAALAVENFSKGHADRGREAGALVG